MVVLLSLGMYMYLTLRTIPSSGLYGLNDIHLYSFCMMRYYE